jgi:hypothetical protein
MPAPVSEKVVEQVRQLWAQNPDLSGHAIAKKYFEIHGDKDIKLRKIIEIVSGVKKAAPKKPFPFAEWKPWVDPQETAEETYFLLLLNYIKQAESGVSLYQHEARWARRLRIGVAGLNPYSQYKLVSLYAVREVISYYLNRPQRSDDLDAFVTFAPWRPHHNWAAYYIYLGALEAGVVPFPEVDPRADLGEDIGPDSMPGVQFPQGLGPEQYPDLHDRLWAGLLWLLMPPKELPTDRESDPQKRQMLELLLKLWTLELETSQSLQYHQQVQQLLALLVGQYANEQEQPREEQLIRN